MLRRGPARQPETLKIADLELDLLRHKAHRAGKRLELTPKEFAVLQLLMRNAGQPVTRPRIVEEIWKRNAEGVTNIVDVYIRHLRSKIDDKWPMKMIQTVRGIGYMLDVPDRPAEKAV